MFSVRPTEYLEKWSERDRYLAESLVRLKQSVCPCGCGQPADLAHDPDTEGWWDVQEVECLARQALEAARPDNPEQDDPSVLRVVTLEDAYFESKNPPRE